jgi:hypothetical protein
MLFCRAARRAGLALEQTQGFSPHPKLALCPPLPVGVVGAAEPADFWFEEWKSCLLEAWRRSLPRGIEISEALEVEGLPLNKLCTAAAYSIEPDIGFDPAAIVESLKSALEEKGIILGAEARGREAILSVCGLDRCGPSYMVKSLVESSVISGWSDLSITRTAVGQWSEEAGMVIPLTAAYNNGCWRPSG